MVRVPESNSFLCVNLEVSIGILVHNEVAAMLIETVKLPIVQ
jgi:hypothetical protein